MPPSTPNPRAPHLAVTLLLLASAIPWAPSNALAAAGAPAASPAPASSAATAATADSTPFPEVPARWAPVSPPGGIVASLASAPASPAIVYAGTANAGVFRSDDGGASWAPRNTDLPAGDWTITGLAVHPQDPNTVFAVPGVSLESTHGLDRSRDGGVTWKALDVDSSVRVNAVAFDGPRAATLFAATDDGLYISPDLGDTWRLAAFAGSSVFAVAADPHRPYVLVALVATPSTAPDQVWRSTDRGATWQGVPVADTALREVQADPLRAGTFYLLSNDAILVSTDDGASWDFLAFGPPFVPTALTTVPAASAAGAEILLVGSLSDGVFTSSDGGLTLTGANPPSPLDIISAFASAADARTVLAAGGTGIWKSPDGGASWNPSSHGLLATLPGAVTVAADGSVFCNLNGTILHSVNQGSQWTQVSTGQDAGSRLVADPQRPAILYEPDDLRVSRDGGRTWQSIAPFAPPHYLQPSAFAVDPSVPNDLYVSGIASLNNGAQPTTYTGASRDGGRTWHALALNLVNANPFAVLAIDPRQGSTLYGAMTTGTLWRSNDSGTTWTQVGAGLPAPAFPTGTPPFPVIALAVDPANSRILYAGTTGHGVYRSADRGLTFAPFNQGLGDTASVSSLLLDARRPGLLLADAGIFGVYRLLTAAGGGDTWELLDGLPIHPGATPRLDDADPNDGSQGPLAFDGRADVLYAVGQQGLYRLAKPDHP